MPKAHIPVRIGDWNFSSTLCQNLDPGIAPSLENAYIILELDVTENVPHKNIETIMMTMSTIAPFVPQVSKKICATG